MVTGIEESDDQSVSQESELSMSISSGCSEPSCRCCELVVVANSQLQECTDDQNVTGKGQLSIDIGSECG